MRIAAVATIGAVIIAAFFFATGREEAPPSITVVLTDSGFVPADFTIKLGGTVTFTTDRGVPFWPASNLHPDHGLYPDFDPRRPLPPGETWTFTFDQVGDWTYHDHLRSYFTGVVHVVD